MLETRDKSPGVMHVGQQIDQSQQDMALAPVAKQVDSIVIEADQSRDHCILDEATIHTADQQEQDVQQIGVSVVHAGKEQQH